MKLQDLLLGNDDWIGRKRVDQISVASKSTNLIPWNYSTRLEDFNFPSNNIQHADSFISHLDLVDFEFFCFVPTPGDLNCHVTLP